MPNPQFSQNLNPDDQKTDYKFQGLRVHAAAFENQFLGHAERQRRSLLPHNNYQWDV